MIVFVCCRDEIYIAPSGVQKERILPEDLFVQTIQNEDLDGPPPQKKLKKSQCTPLFMNAYTMGSKDVFIVVILFLLTVFVPKSTECYRDVKLIPCLTHCCWCLHHEQILFVFKVTYDFEKV